jgi:hypothetical protein
MESTRVILRLRQARGRATGGVLPDPLVAATVQAAVRVAQNKATATGVLSRGATQLVCDALRALAQDRWRLGHPD